MHKTRILLVFIMSLGISLIYGMSFFKNTIMFYDTNIIQLLIRSNPPMDKFTKCLLDAQHVFVNLSLPWFLAFGTALMYYRSNNFISDDIDIGIFIDDFEKMNISHTTFISTVRRHGFKLRSVYGNMTHGQGWTLECPCSKLHFGIFVFYHGDLANNETFAWWTASYNGLCNKKRYHKCRWSFPDFKLDTFEMYGQQFQVASKQFLTVQYGPTWMTPRKYGYFESLEFLTNLIDE
ncbi:unnamed protein product [Adineta steineri]|uniref:Uncharacterized protein n=1 Tax=Adineta steineri TaxID=433720 RepID=A0A819IIV0_9BILA|nr:unnamed protein product [Adineta steineri]CAF3917185.1 unnamed protein product [Adineta steineri]